MDKKEILKGLYKRMESHNEIRSAWEEIGNTEMVNYYINKISEIRQIIESINKGWF